MKKNKNKKLRSSLEIGQERARVSKNGTSQEDQTPDIDIENLRQYIENYNAYHATPKPTSLLWKLKRIGFIIFPFSLGGGGCGAFFYTLVDYPRWEKNLWYPTYGSWKWFHDWAKSLEEDPNFIEYTLIGALVGFIFALFLIICCHLNGTLWEQDM